MKSTSLKKNTIANYIGQAYTMLIGVVMLPFYLNHLGAEAYGLVGFFTMLASIMMLLDMGFSQALTRETAKLKDKINGLIEIKRILRSVESIISILSVSIFIGVYFSSSWIASQWLATKDLDIIIVENTIKLMGLIVALRWYISLYYGLLLGLEQQVWLNFFKIIIATFKFVGGLIFILFISNEIFSFFIYQAVVALIELIILNNRIYKNLPSSKFIVPSMNNLKKIAPFALSLAYVSGVWIVYTQLDKLLLSHYIPLSEYGYFTLVIVVSNIIMQFSNPLSQAILPRMISLLSNGKEEDMLILYRKSTQVISIIIFSVVSLISFYSYELLFSWSGNKEAAMWAAPLLSWYVLGNGILALGAFQYYLQFAHGNLKYHIKFNTYFPFISLPITFYMVIEYGALGAAISWFTIQLIGFLFWPAFIHSRFSPGLHRDWITKDIMPAFLMAIIYIGILNMIDIDFDVFSRVEIFIILISLGSGLLVLNVMVYKYTRTMMLNMVYKNSDRA